MERVSQPARAWLTFGSGLRRRSKTHCSFLFPLAVFEGLLPADSLQELGILCRQPVWVQTNRAVIGEGSLYRWLRNTAKDRSLLAACPVPRQAGWVEHVNTPQTEAELAAIRRSVNHGRPFADVTWYAKAVRRLGLETTLRPRGRPKKQNNGS